jgi:hypothetical protein
MSTSETAPAVETPRNNRIINLKVSNFKRISGVEITPHGDVVTLGGMNEQGKSSVLDAIQSVLSGKSAIPEMPVRLGEERSVVIVETDDYLAKRVFRPNGTSEITLQNKVTGAKEAAPQKILDTWASSVGFDPLAFMSMKPKDQLERLRQMVGLDFTEADAERQRAFDMRTIANRDHKAAQAQYDGMEHYPDAPAVEVTMSDLAAEFQAASEKNAAIAKTRDLAQEVFLKVEALQKNVGDIQSKIKALQEQLAQAEKDLLVEIDRQEKAKAWLASDKAQAIDTAPIQQRMKEIEAVNAKVRASAARVAKYAEVEKHKALADNLSAKIEALDADKSAQLAAAKFPLHGLSFTGECVTFHGVPIAQASQAVKIKISVAIAVALNPKMRVMLIRDGAFLDAGNFKLLADLAHEYDFQMWIERVGDGPEVTVVIQDGTVSETR